MGNHGAHIRPNKPARTWNTSQKQNNTSGKRTFNKKKRDGTDMNIRITQLILCTLLCALLCVSAAAAFDEKTEGRLTITSDPDNADVWISGEFIGYTPCSTIVRADSAVNLRIEKHGGNYQLWQGSAYVPAGQDVSFNATLYKKTETARSTGIIAVSANIEGADVYMDNSYMGKITGGNYNIDQAKLGLHYIVVKMDGYTDYTTMAAVNPKNMATTNIAATLTPLGTTTPAATEAQPATATVPPAPTKSPVCACLPLLAIIGALILNRK